MIPVRAELTSTLCVDVCGARCCRNPKIHYTLQRHEVERLAAAARRLGIERWMVRQEVDDPDWFVVRHDENGGVCPFLDQSSNRCRVYDERPEACRTFPKRPEPDCLAWPEVS